MRRNQKIAALLILFFLLNLSVRSVLSDPSSAKQTSGKSKTVLKGGVGATSHMTGTVSSSPLGYDVTAVGGKATISKVTEGSEAWARGLKVGDGVVEEKKNGNNVAVTIQRGGKIYQANLTSGAAAIEPRRTASLVGGTTLQQHLAVLSNHNVYLIIDKSGSMATRDCPASVSRWRWCADQTRDLTEATGSCGCLNEGITIVVFSDTYSVYPNATVKRISDIFENNQPDGTTNTGDALEAMIDDYFLKKSRAPATTKPAVIAVVTDGEPNKPEQVRQVIIDATKRMTDPNELSITFLQVGGAPFGAALLHELDNNLVYEGAYYDIVDTKSFTDLEKIGLVGAIAEAITALRTPSPRQARPAATAAKALPQPIYRRDGGGSRVVRQPTQYTAPARPSAVPPDQDLKQAEQQRRDIERKLLEN